MDTQKPKKPTSLFRALEAINSRPAPFQFYTAAELWTDEHTSKQMLDFHLNGDVDISSRNTQFIKRSVKWICSRFKISTNTSVIDFGCGPGLYTNRFAKKKADVTGVDFSARAIAYAKDAAVLQGLEVSYIHQNYLDFETTRKFDLITMIMCDFCALGPAQRSSLLNKFHSILNPGGSLLLDVYSLNEFEKREESTAYEINLLNGFWSPERYHGFLNTFKYPDEKVILDKYTIIGEKRVRQVFNWLQYFTPSSLGAEFYEGGFTIAEVYSDATGTEYRPDSPEFVVIAKKN